MFRCSNLPGAAVLAWLLLASPGVLPAQEPDASSTATGTSRAFNPAISVNGLFIGLHTSDPFTREPLFGEHAHEEEEEHHEGEEPDEHDHAEEGEEHAHGHGLPETSGLAVQEVEIRLSAFVDTYLKGDVTLAIPGTEGVELEEGFVETVTLPSVTLRAGKFYSRFGKHNRLHTHAFPFIDPPVVHERILGGEGLNEVGVGADLLLPTAWYSEVTVQAVNGDNALFASPDGEDLAYVGNWRNLFEAGESSTIELGASYAGGRNAHTQSTHLIGGDFTFKWLPVRQRYRAFILQGEYIHAQVADEGGTLKTGGYYALAQLRFDRRWWVQGRFDKLGVPQDPALADSESRVSALIAFVPSEFSALRLQYNRNRHLDETVHQVVLQLNVTMGSHPAHAY